jgi:hypothetical protein
MAKRHLLPHDEVKAILRRVGYSPEQIEDVLREFPDPIDIDHSRDALLRHGISLGGLMDQMGGSP